MTLDPDVILRDHNTQGDSGSGVFNPIKGPLRQLLKSHGRMAASNVVWVATLAELQAKTGLSDDTGGMVWGDSTAANNGVYRYDATSSPAAWEKVAGLPHTAAVLTNIGGTANAITADTETGVDPAEVKMLVLPDPPATNTSTTVTITLNGGSAESVKAASGSNVAIGDIIDGVGTLLFKVGSEWRQLFSSQTGATMDFQGAWDSGTTYTQSQFVTKNNKLFFLDAASSLNEDPELGAPWLEVFDLVSAVGIQAKATIAAMTAITKSSLVDGSIVVVKDASRGGNFEWDASATDTADNGMIFASDEGGTGRFIRRHAPIIDLAFFGAVRDSQASAATNDAAIVNAISYCAANKKPLWVIGNYFISDTIVPAVAGQGVHMWGVGSGYWPALPAAKRSTTDDIVVASPAQFTVTGEMPRNITVVGISTMKECGASRTNASAEGAGFNDTEFRLLDWSSSAFSAAIDVPAGTLGGGIRGIRIVLDQGGADGLDGYFGAQTTAYDELANSECDVGILLERCPDFYLDSVHVVGPWRKAGRFILTTPRDGDETDDAHNVSPYNMVARDCIFEGYKATSIRGYDSFKIVAITATTLDVIYADDHPFDTGGGTIYLHQNQYATTAVNYTSAAMVAGSPNLLRFSGLDADLTGTYSAGDGIEPYNSGGSSGILDDHCRYGGYHHPSGYQCHATALPNPFSFPGGGIEISGRRITEITFKNWMIQHVEQIGWHLHECREIYFGEAGQAEGNVPNGSSLQGLKFIGSPHHSVNTYNTPGSASYSSGGTFYTYVGCSDMIFGDPNDFRPQVPMVSVGRWSNGSDNGFWEPNYSRMPQAAFTADMDQGPALVPPPGGSAGIAGDQGPSSANQLPGSHAPAYKLRHDASVDKNKTHVDLLPNLNNTYDLGGSGAQFAEVWTFNLNSGAAGINVVINGATALFVGSTALQFRPDNTVSCGSGSFRSSVVYSATGTINTSDEREKQDIQEIPDSWLDAWGEVEFIRYKWKDAVQKKKDGARWHVGLIAQRVRDVFAAHGLDAMQIGLLCYDEWDDIPAEINNDGNETSPAVPAGNRYGIRYEEAMVLEAAYQRREIEKLKALLQ